MDELTMRIQSLFAHQLNCSQVIMMLANEMRGIDNPELIRAMGGLGNGLFCREKTCGTLLGGCALLGSYGARSEPGDSPAYPYNRAIVDLVDWFEAEFGSSICCDIVEDDKLKMLQLCPELVAKTFAHCMEILDENGVDPYQ